MKSTDVTCLIPAYNESTRLPYVLARLRELPEIGEVIVVDDGSSDDTSAVASTFKNATVIRHQHNLGKTEAVRTGLKNAKSNNILLFDADLTYFDTSPIKKAIDAFIHKENLACITLRAEYIKIKFTRADLIQSGIRLIRKKYLQEILSNPITGYQIEAAICFYMLENNLENAWTTFPSKQLNKALKRNLLSGLISDIRMNLEIFKYRGFVKYWQMVLGYQPTKLP